MLRVLSCIRQEHDVRLVALAVLICVLAAFIAISSFQHARSDVSRRTFFLALAATVSGLGIWATHFVAMLAYQPRIPIGYDVGTTLASVTVAVLVTGIGLSVALRDRPITRLLGGAILGGGIATMHYVGMAAVQLAGVILWDRKLVATSVAVGIGLSALIFWSERRNRHQQPWLSTLLLAGAICGLHFTAMAAATIMPTHGMLPAGAIDSNALALFVIFAILVILGVGFGLLMFDQRLALVRQAEAYRGTVAEPIAQFRDRAWQAGPATNFPDLQPHCLAREGFGRGRLNSGAAPPSL